MEHYGLQVDDKNPAVGGLGRIETPDGYTFPLSYKSGLAYLKMRPLTFTTTKWKTLPHVMMTSDKIWDPTVFDVDVDPNSTEFLASHPEQLHKLPTPDFNMLGEYIRVNKLLHNGTIEFDEFISGELFENAIQEEDHTDNDEDSFQFWMHDEDYQHQQTISRCMHSSRDIIDESDILLALNWKLMIAVLSTECNLESTPPVILTLKACNHIFLGLPQMLLRRPSRIPHNMASCQAHLVGTSSSVGNLQTLR